MKTTKLLWINLLVLSSVSFFSVNCADKDIPPVAKKFYRLADFAKEVIEKKVSFAYSGQFAQNIAYAAKEFENAEKLFCSNKQLFIKQKEVRNIFNKLRKTIDYIDKFVSNASDFKQRHLFWLIDNVVQVNIMSKVVWPEVNDDDKENVKILKQNKIEFLTATLRFSMKMNDDVFPYLSKYVGTKFGYIRDFFIYKFLKKYWWTLPLTAVGLTAVWSGYKHSRMPKEIIVPNEKEIKKNCFSKWWTAFVAAPIGLIFLGLGASYNQHFIIRPVDDSYTRKASIRKFNLSYEDTNNSKNLGDYSIITVPSLNRKKFGSSALVALYNTFWAHENIKIWDSSGLSHRNFGNTRKHIIESKKLITKWEDLICKRRFNKLKDNIILSAKNIIKEYANIHKKGAINSNLFTNFDGNGVTFEATEGIYSLKNIINQKIDSFRKAHSNWIKSKKNIQLSSVIKSFNDWFKYMNSKIKDDFNPLFDCWINKKKFDSILNKVCKLIPRSHKKIIKNFRTKQYSNWAINLLKKTKSEELFTGFMKITIYDSEVNKSYETKVHHIISFKNLVKIYYQYSNSKIIHENLNYLINTDELKWLITKHVPKLKGSNGIAENISIVKNHGTAMFTGYNNFNTPIKSNDGIKKLVKNINRFRETGETQYCIIFTGNNPNNNLKNCDLEWDKSYYSCYSNHVILLIFSKKDGDNKVYVFDPYKGNDNGLSPLVHLITDLYMFRPIEEINSIEIEIEEKQ